MDIGAIRSALRGCLESLGYEVASDSHGLRPGLYIVGEGDLARAVFEFKLTAEDAFHDLYQGRWVEGLPPRFVVLPASEARATSLEMLEQIGVSPVFFTRMAEHVAFDGLTSALEERLGA